MSGIIIPITSTCMAQGRQLKLRDEHPYIQESIKALIELYEAWNKSEEVEKWRANLPQTEAVMERHVTSYMATILSRQDIVIPWHVVVE